MKQADYIQRDYIPSVDLNTLGNTYNTLQQGHEKAIETMSNLRTTMANFDLNENENEWRQQKINEIEKVIEDNTIYGNAYRALDDIILKQGDLMSDQALIGRLQAQKDYKAFQTSIDNNKELSEDYKRYFKAVNPYKYEDIINDKGQIIGGTKWTPIKSPTTVIPLNTLMTQALNWVAKESGGSNYVRWIDKNGNITTDFSESATGEYFDSVTNSWKKISKDKLNKALIASIESTPGAKASLHQDYEVARWKYDTDGNNPDIVDKNGKILNEEGYLKKRIDPFFDAATYYNQINNIEYNEARDAQGNISRQITPFNPIPADVSTTTSSLITIKNTLPSKATGDITAYKQTISDILGKDVDINNLSNEDILKIARNKNISEQDILKIRLALDGIIENQEYLNSIAGDASPDEKAQFDVYNAIISLSDLPEVNKDNEKYIKQYNDIVNSFFYGGKAIRQYYNDQENIDAFYSAIGGKNKAISLGIKEGVSNGIRYIELPYEYNKSLYSFARANKLAYEQNNNIFSMTADVFKSSLFPLKSNRLVIVNNDNTETTPRYMSHKENMKDITYRNQDLELYSQSNRIYNALINFVSDLQKTNDKITDGGNLSVSNNIINAETPAVAEIIAMRKSNPTEASKYSQTLDDEKKEAYLALSNVDLVQTGAYVLSDNNDFREVSSDERKTYTSILRSSKPSDLGMSIIQDPNTGNFGVYVTIKGTKKDNGDVDRKPISLYIPNGINSKVFESWNNDTNFKAKNDINVYAAANRPITIASSNMFGLTNTIKLVPNGNGFTIMDGNEAVNNIDNDMAITLRDNYYQYRYLYNAIASGQNFKEEYVNAIVNKVAIGLASIYNSENNENVVKYYVDNLKNSLYNGY